MDGIKRWFTPLFFMTALLVSATVLTGCGSSSDTDISGKGDLVISLTDLEGDFKKYEVDILSIMLTRKNGEEIETLPLTTRIDFTRYVNLSEILTVGSAPLGAYREVTMLLDYTKADIQVEVSGVPLRAEARDADGNKLETLAVTVKLGPGNRAFVIAPGILTHLSLDFDLEQSNKVNTGVNPPVVTVTPLLIAELNPDFRHLKRHRMRGPLLSIDESEETFTLGIHPFHDPIPSEERNFGTLKVVTHTETSYKVDGGVAGTGSTGFALLAETPLLTTVIVFGKLDALQRIFKADKVLAGSSVLDN